MLIKICGLQREADIEIINELDVNYGGFIFAESRRYVLPKKAKELIEQMNKPAVGVFVDEELEKVVDIANMTGIRVIQLHGNESTEYIKALKNKTNCEIWKTIHVKDKTSLHLLKEYCVDVYLLDYYDQCLYGGSGKSFNHQLLEGINLDNVFIAGGIDSYKISQLKYLSPLGFDISSSVETNGFKDKEKIKKLLEEIRYE